ncbi:primosomal protein N' [Prevotella sp. HMSC077E09]|uniref:replication restart helicase PriA n=1 Tax=Prevotella sp. HMSC077E09 TaxID=1739487 RepID=UPI0008A31232|nr:MULTISPECIES: primosomal protein N' [unclassified Prevotella]OFO83046.1 primosomal protein N' [Prevotella sp. HMSC077E08]OFP54601.1 primosomal protein N' [Prevotella sp. HMSC077E09]
MKYVEVVLPLPLDGLFTYAVADNQAAKAQVGCRVLVPLGKSKKYIGIVMHVVDEKPEFEVKPIIEVIDRQPILLHQQIRLWQWISDYYLSPLGDIYKAALPSGLKAEEGYRPKKETYITLSEAFRSEQTLHVAMNMLTRATKQLKAFVGFLSLSHWDTLNGTTPQEPLTEITREELMNATNTSLATVKALVDRNILTLYQKEVGRLNTSETAHPECMKPLSTAQSTAFEAVNELFATKKVVLLQGVTSSGKTEIYIHLIQQALDRGEQVLYLLPEIALTVQITSRLKKVFGNRLGIYHSKYSDAERVEMWNKQLSNAPYEVILGARSAVFLPFQKLGLVIVDEEHETSFKQQDPAPRYHARSAAIVLASMYQAKTLLGTATPSLESYYNAQQGKYGLVTLTTRFKGIQLPQVEVVDTKDLQRRKMMTGPFSPRLLEAVRQALHDDRQVILFQNRRGFAPRIECKECGWVPKCTNCDVTLTYHKNLNQLSCHYCGFTYSVPVKCPQCGSEKLVSRGYGTEKVEDQVRELFPEARVARMDLDTTHTRNAYERIIDDFSAGRTNILIGTQMISKGLDFDNVSVVGILDADAMLNYPDFRAYEHAFMMMSQVSGRAGRKGRQGLVILQTKSADLPVIGQVVRHDFKSFCTDLLDERSLFHYPPFYHLVYVYLKHTKNEVVETAALEMGSRLRQYFSDRILGPDKPAIARVKTMHIRKIVIKLEHGINLKRVREVLRYVQKQMMQDKRYAALHIYYDVDPM